MTPYSKTERVVRAATRHKRTWGPTGSQLSECSELTYNPADCVTVFQVLELRLGYPPAKWRAV